jgi:uncharacterized protein (DUF1697 family)
MRQIGKPTSRSYNQAMPKYVALLRGIGPSNPNMQQKKLCAVFEKLGFSNAQGVISSGNVVFESPSKDIRKLENTLEKAWPARLGFNSTTIVRSQKQLQQLVADDPFKGLAHGRASYLLVTFFKNPQNTGFTLPYQPPDRPYKLVAAFDDAICTVTDNSVLPTTDLMTWLEKRFGREITSRTWLTVQRILKKMA